MLIRWCELKRNLSIRNREEPDRHCSVGKLMLFSVSEENRSDPSDSVVVCEGDRNKDKLHTIVVTDNKLAQSFYV